MHTIGNTLVHLLVRVIRKPRIVCHETKLGQHLRHEHGGGLLTIHANCKGLRPPKEKERVEGRQRVTDCVYGERDVLWRDSILVSTAVGN